MESENIIISYANKTFSALENKYKSVLSCNREAFNLLSKNILNKKPAFYMGIKNTPVISEELISNLNDNGFFEHTLDVSSEKGRAVCHNLNNPITLKPMTGSSSGTAINVFLDINDLGIGTDGGGSVLCPALALNLYSLITKEIYVSDKYKKQSTDNISFTPSVGFISKDLDILRLACIASGVSLQGYNHPITVLIPKANNIFTPTKKDINKIIKNNLNSNTKIIEIEFPDVYSDRASLINFLNNVLKKDTVVLSFEGPIDYIGMGDSLFGHFDDFTSKEQSLSGKGLTRVSNMIGANAMTVPHTMLSSGFVLIGKVSIGTLFYLCEQLPQYESSELLKRYFN